VKIVRSLPNFETATAIWTDEALKDTYINQLKGVYDQVIDLVGNDAVESKITPLIDKNTTLAGVGHGTNYPEWIFTGQNYAEIYSHSHLPPVGFAWLPVSCLLGWQCINDLIGEGWGMAKAEVIEYSLTDTGVKYYVQAETDLEVGVLGVKSDYDLTKLIVDSYNRQIDAARQANDGVDMSILMEDRDNMASKFSWGIVQTIDVDIHVIDQDGLDVPYAVVNVFNNIKDTKSTDAVGHVHFQLVENETYNIIVSYKDQVVYTGTFIAQPHVTIQVNIPKPSPPQPPTPPSPPQPPEAKEFSGDHEGELTGVIEGTLWLGPFRVPVTLRLDGGKYKGTEKGEVK